LGFQSRLIESPACFHRNY